MTAYQDTPYYPVDSPLNQPENDDYWWAEADAEIDPMIAVQQRMMIILAAALLFLSLIHI